MFASPVTFGQSQPQLFDQTYQLYSVRYQIQHFYGFIVPFFKDLAVLLLQTMDNWKKRLALNWPVIVCDKSLQMVSCNTHFKPLASSYYIPMLFLTFTHINSLSPCQNPTSEVGIFIYLFILYVRK